MGRSNPREVGTERRWLRRFSLLAAGALLASFAVAMAAPQPRAIAAGSKPITYDEIILLDITASLLGQGTDPRARNIWSQVQHAAEQLVSEVAPGTHFAIVPFDTGPRWSEVFPHPIQPNAPLPYEVLNTAGQRQAAVRFIQGLVPDGQNTYIYQSVQYASSQLTRWQAQDRSHFHQQALFIYTDGLDNGPDAGLGIAGIARQFHACATDNRHLYAVYNDVALQLDPSQIQQLRSSCVQVVRGPALGHIPQVVGLTYNGNALGDLSHGTHRIALHFGGYPSSFLATHPMLRVQAPPPLRVSAPLVPLQSTIVETVTTSSQAVGSFADRLEVSPAGGNFTISPNGSIPVTYSWTLDPAGTATARSSATAAAQATSAAIKAQATAAAVATATAIAVYKKNHPPQPNYALFGIIAVLVLAVLLIAAYFLIDRVKRRFAENAVLSVGGTPFNLAELQGSGPRRATVLPIGGEAPNAIGLPGFESTVAAHVRPFGREAIQIRGTGAADLTKDGEPIEGWTPMYPSDTVRIGPQSVTYNVAETELVGAY